MALAVLLFRFFSTLSIGKTNASIFLIFVGLFGGAGMFLLAYLRGDFAVRRTGEEEYSWPERTSGYTSPSYEIEEIQSTIKDLKQEIGIVKKNLPNLKELSSGDRESLLTTLKMQLEGVLASDVVRQIENKYAAQILNDAQVAQIRKGILDTSLRLRTEIGALSRRGNLNLVIGTLTTVAAVGLLAYLVLGAAINYNNIPDLLSHFIPRVSIAVFIEVFSFFFLKLYKSSLQEIKYFQNELTNVEMRGIALETALLGTSNATTGQIVEQLIRTDRNPTSGTFKGSDEKDGAYVEPKDIANLLDKLGKLLSIGAQK
ncbi:MAG TPA: hypothetical protein VIT88_09900 [Pyrinomonadaceae bacterium]